MNPPIQSQKTTILPLLIALTLACFALSPTARAVTPAPDGGYPNFNTAEGDNALFSLDTSQGVNNTAIGFQALFSNTTGNGNTANGASALFSLTTGFYNTAIGSNALYSNTTGLDNTAIGVQALFSTTYGTDNTASGFHALLHNTTGSNNTANGSHALELNTTGYDNTAVGLDALFSNTEGAANTASGNSALYSNTTGGSNTAAGSNALYSNTTGYNNTAVGVDALLFNTIGIANTGIGAVALQSNTTGSDNVAIGDGLASNTTGSTNTAIGVSALGNNTIGSSNIAVGFFAAGNLTTGNNNIDIGNPGVAGESRTIRIGTRQTHRATFIAGISGATVPTGVAVIVDGSGHLGTTTSSARFKEAIKPMDEASEAILALKPVTFRYKHELDPDSIPQFGLVAEQVEKVNPDLVARDDQGKPYTVRYEAVNAMLLNEFLKEHREVAELKSTVAEQRKGMEAMAAQLKAQASQTVVDNH